MTSFEEKDTSGILGQIRRLSRRLSGNILAADSKDVRAYYGNFTRKNISSYDEDGQLKISGVSLNHLAEEYGTPLYVYDVNRLVDNYNQYLGSLKHIKNFMLCYAVKANSNLALLDIFAKLGSGFDVVSGGEVARCLKAGVDPAKIVFSGCGKSYEEIELAVKAGVGCINVESGDELDRIQEAACKANVIQNISVRVNPDILLDGHSHPNILTGGLFHKFGVPINSALEVYNHAKASSNLKIKGISCHLGSNIGQLEPFIEARDKLLALADELRTELKICVEHINLGGGFAAQIDSNINTPDIPQWVEKLAKPITERGLKLVLEPGRSLVADAGVLLTKVEYVKTVSKATSGGTSPRSGSFISGVTPSSPKPNSNSKTFVVLDAGFNDFARAALYGAQHPILPVLQKPNPIPIDFKYDIVGPICETTDVFSKDFSINQKIEAGDYLIIADAGAYGSSMASGYNSRRKAAEVLINDGRPVVIAERGSYEQRFANEKPVCDLKLKTLNAVEESNESVEDLTTTN